MLIFVIKTYATQYFAFLDSVICYREYQLKDSQYVNLNEAIIEVLDDGFDTDDFKNSRIKLFEYRMNHYFPRDKTKEIFYDNMGKGAGGVFEF